MDNEPDLSEAISEIFDSLDVFAIQLDYANRTKYSQLIDKISKFKMDINNFTADNRPKYTN